MRLLEHPAGARTENEVFAYLEAAVLDALRSGRSAIAVAPEADAVLKASAFAIAVLYGLELEGFSPSSAEDDEAVTAALHVVMRWLEARAPLGLSA